MPGGPAGVPAGQEQLLAPAPGGGVSNHGCEASSCTARKHDVQDHHAAEDNPDQIKHDPTPYQPPPALRRLYTATPAPLPSYGDALRRAAHGPERNGEAPQPATASRLSAGLQDDGVTRMSCRRCRGCCRDAWPLPRSQPFSGRAAGVRDGQRQRYRRPVASPRSQSARPCPEQRGATSSQ